MSQPASPVRIGAVSYLNSKPLIDGLDARVADFGVLTTDLPSRLADQLHAAKIDLGLIPVFESFSNAEYRAVSSAGIVCHGPVWSVRLLFRKPPAEVQTVALDEGSRTSAALSKVLLFEQLGFIPKALPFPMTTPPEDVAGDAVLIIGDRAMNPEKYLDAFPYNWDLGEVWKQMTGLPFVFARWIARDERFNTPFLEECLHQTRDHSVANIDPLVKRWHAQYDMTEATCKEYLTRFIQFYIDADAQRGLDEFRRRCHHLKLIPESPHFSNS